jgi:hypothetical protein
MPWRKREHHPWFATNGFKSMGGFLASLKPYQLLYRNINLLIKSLERSERLHHWVDKRLPSVESLGLPGDDNQHSTYSRGYLLQSLFSRRYTDSENFLWRVPEPMLNRGTETHDRAIQIDFHCYTLILLYRLQWSILVAEARSLCGTPRSTTKFKHQLSGGSNE